MSATPQRDETFHVEQRGTELIPEAQRHGRPWDLFPFWFGLNANVFFPIIGFYLIAGLKLSFIQAIPTILLGNLLGYLLTGLGSIQGPSTGARAFVISRSSFGFNGNRGVSFLNWLQFIGFEASGVVLAVFAVQAIFQSFGITQTGTVVFVIIATIAIVAIQIVVPLFGHATILSVTKWLAWLFAGFFLLITVFSVASGKTHLTGGNGTLFEITVGLAAVMVADGMGWVSAANDYSCYLPRAANKRSIVFAVALGGFLSAALLEVLGAAVGSSASDPINGLSTLLLSVLLVPFMLILILNLVAVNNVDLYSSGLNLLAMGVKLRRVYATLVDMVICFPLVLLAALSTGFNSFYGQFLSLLVVFYAPWTAIFLADCLLRRNHYDANKLIEKPLGPWYKVGFNWNGLISLALGMIASLTWINSPLIQGPLSHLFGNSDLSAFTGFIVGGGLYVLLAFTKVKPYTQLQAVPEVLAD